MTTTTKKAAKPAPAKGLKALGTDFATRAKDAQARFAGRREELVKFGNDNLAAVKASGEALRSGARPLLELVVGNAKGQLAANKATLASLKGVKSPVAAFKIQSEANKAAFAAAREDTVAFAGAVRKLAGEVAAPLKDRFAAVRSQAA